MSEKRARRPVKRKAAGRRSVHVGEVSRFVAGHSTSVSTGRCSRISWRDVFRRVRQRRRFREFLPHRATRGSRRCGACRATTDVAANGLSRLGKL